MWLIGIVCALPCPLSGGEFCASILPLLEFTVLTWYTTSMGISTLEKVFNSSNCTAINTGSTSLCMRVDKIFLKKEQGQRQMPHFSPCSSPLKVWGMHTGSGAGDKTIINIFTDNEVLNCYFFILLCTEECNKWLQRNFLYIKYESYIKRLWRGSQFIEHCDCLAVTIGKPWKTLEKKISVTSHPKAPNAPAMSRNKQISDICNSKTSVFN